MGLFSKKTNITEEISKIFFDQFPTWAVQHSTKLVYELKTSGDDIEKNWVDLLHNNQSAEKILIDCLAGAHATYLSLGLPEVLIALIGGEKKIASAIQKWSERSQKFFIVASTLHKNSLENDGRSIFVASLEKVFAADGKLEPLAVHIGAAAVHEIESELKKDLGSFFVAGLYRVIFRLQEEQLDWISNEVLEKAKKHN